jgi:hypothetical protein
VSGSRTPAPAVVAVVLAVAVSLLGVLLLPGPPAACGSACCCGSEGAEVPASAPCPCSVSPSAPVPTAVLASVDPVAPPALAGVVAEGVVVETGAGTAARTPTVPRARSAPTQALLETFRI